MEDSTTDKGLLSEHEAALVLGVSRATLERWRLRGYSGEKARAPVPVFIRLGARAVRYDPNDLAEFIDAQRRTSTSDPGPESRPTA